MGLCAQDFLTHFCCHKGALSHNPAGFWQEYKAVIQQLEEIRREESRGVCCYSGRIAYFIIADERGITGVKVGGIPAGVMEEDDDEAVAIKDGC